MLLESHPLTGQPIMSAEPSSLAIQPVADCARYNLRIAPENLARAAKAFGSGLPDKIGATVASGEKLALCLGPDEWQLYAPLAASDAIEAAFTGLYASCPHSLVDTSHREIGISVEGTAAVLALRSACAFDFDAMAPGTGVRTIFDKSQIVLIRLDDDRFRIEVWRSFATHVWGLLEAASHEIALGI